MKIPKMLAGKTAPPVKKLNTAHYKGCGEPAYVPAHQFLLSSPEVSLAPLLQGCPQELEQAARLF